MNSKKIKKGEPQEVRLAFLLVRRCGNAVIRHEYGAE